MLSELNVIRANLRLHRARENYIAAGFDLGKSFYEAANNRAYSCMYHAVCALMALDDEDHRTKAVVMWYLKKDYIQPGLLDPRMTVMFEDALKSKINGYDSDCFIPNNEEARRNIENAALFLDNIEDFIARRVEREYSLSTSQ